MRAIVAGALLAVGVISATAQDDWRAKLQPAERACVTQIEKTEGRIEKVEVANRQSSSERFNLLLHVNLSGKVDPISVRCQGTESGGNPTISDISRE